MMRAVALALALAALVAGCSGPATSSDAAVNDATQVVRGVVVDDAIRPLADVTLAIPGQPDVPAATTDRDGAFALAGVRPGVVFVLATKEGYLSATVQVPVEATREPPLTQIRLQRLEESRPFAVLETFRGHVECGAGSAPLAGLSAGCRVLVGSALYVACTGSGPVPPTGVCLGGTNPYFVSLATGNMTIAQTEVVWEPTVSGMSELLLGSYIVDREGVVVGGAPGVSGHSVLVRRLNATFVDEQDLGGTHQLALFVNPGNSGPFNVVVQQSYDVFHTSTFLFEPAETWTFARDGPVPVPDACTACLQS